MTEDVVVWLNVDYRTPEDLARTVAHEVVHHWQCMTRGECLDDLEHDEREREAECRADVLIPEGSIRLPSGTERDAWFEPARRGGASAAAGRPDGSGGAPPTTYATRLPRHGRSCAIGDSRYGARDGRRLCEHEVNVEMPEGPGGRAGASPALCAEFAAIVWVAPEGDVTVTCAGHVPHPEDESLKPDETYQLGSWERIDYTVVHPLTGCQPVALQDCDELVLRRAAAVAAKLAEYDRLPKRFGIGPGWKGTLEDQERLLAASEEAAFPCIPGGHA